MKKFFGVGLFVFLCGSLMAQSSYVIPFSGGYATKEGNSYTWTLGKYAPIRSQFIYSKKEMPPAQFVIKTVAARPNGGSSYAGGHSFLTEIWMSNNDKDPIGGYTKLFAGNRGSDYTQVMKSTTIKFPKCTGAKPEKFNIIFNLTKPFLYKGKAFLIEFKHSASQYTYYSYYLDAASSYNSYTAPKYGPSYAIAGSTGCPSNFKIYHGYTATATGCLYYTYGYTRKKGVPFVDILGTNSQKWGSINLPVPLSAFGFNNAPGCKLYIDVMLTNVSQSDPNSLSGFAYSVWGAVPVDPSIIGIKTYHQWFAFDSTYNGDGIGASNGIYATINDGHFGGTVPFFNFYTYGKGGAYTFTGEEGAARYYTQKALILELK